MNILTRVKRACKRSLIQFSLNQFGTCKRGLIRYPAGGGLSEEQSTQCVSLVMFCSSFYVIVCDLYVICVLMPYKRLCNDVIIIHNL